MRRKRHTAQPRPRPQRPRHAGIPEVPTTVLPTPTTVPPAAVGPAAVQTTPATEDAVEDAVRRMVEAAYT